MTMAAAWGMIESHLGDSAHRTERAELAALPALLSGVRHFVDVGASFGPFTWAAHYALRDACITAIDANPRLCRHIEREVQRINDLEDTRGNKIIVRNNAISNVSGDVTFLVNASDYSTSRIAAGDDEQLSQPHMRSVTVQAYTLDELFSPAPPDLIKLDVEGFEWRAIDGARGILQQQRTSFLVEIHPWGDASIQKTPRDVFALLREHDYGVKRMNHHWLFIPGRSGLGEFVRSRFYAECVENRWARELARLVLSKGR
jgi:FkbM family methyltransferase